MWVNTKRLQKHNVVEAFKKGLKVRFQRFETSPQVLSVTFEWIQSDLLIYLSLLFCQVLLLSELNLFL